MYNLHRSHSGISLGSWTCNDWQNRWWIFLPGFFLQEVIHWVGSLLNHCQKIGMDLELVLHMWVLGFSPGSSSSLRGCLPISPFPAFYLYISCSDFQDGHASCKIYSFHLLWLTTRLPFLQNQGHHLVKPNFHWVTQKNWMSEILPLGIGTTAYLLFWAVARYMQKYVLFPLNVDQCSLIGCIETRFKAFCDTVLGYSTACPSKLYLILSVSGINEIPNCSCVHGKLRGCILSAGPLAAMLTFP